MSLSASTSLAVARDAAPKNTPVQLDDQQVTWSKALVSAIPTEVLAAYTAGLGVAIALVTPTDPRAYLPFRVWWYIGWIVATPLIAWLLFQRKARAHPLVDETKVNGWKALLRPEIIAPTLAAAAWFTAMPGSPWQVWLTSSAFQLTSLVVGLVGSVVIGLIAPTLMVSTDTPPNSPPPPGGAAVGSPTVNGKSEAVDVLAAPPA